MYFTKLKSLQSVKLDSVCQLCKIYVGWLWCSDEISHPCLGRFKALSSLCHVDPAVLPEEVPLSDGERQLGGQWGSFLVGWEWQRLQFQLQGWLGELEALACVCGSQVATSWWLLLCPGDGVSQSSVGPAGWVQVHAVVGAGDSGGNQRQPELSFLALWFNCPHEFCDYCYFLKWKIPVLPRTAGAGKTWTNKTLKKKIHCLWCFQIYVPNRTGSLTVEAL